MKSGRKLPKNCHRNFFRFASRQNPRARLARWQFPPRQKEQPMKFELKSKFNNFIYLLLTLLFVCTAVNVGLNFADSGDSDLSNIAVAADQPTNTNYYWTDTEAQTEQGVDFTNYTLSGSGSKTVPYLIQSETDLAFLSWTIYNDQVYGGSDNKYTSGSDNYFYSDVYFKQTKNLDLSAYYWQPIGIYYTRTGTTARRYFSGNYDGGDYTVSGVFTPAGSGNGYSYQGLFGYIYGRRSTLQASIANVGVIDSFIQAYYYVGGVIGRAETAIITNCYNIGAVECDNPAGGIVGSADDASVTNCYNTGSVSGRIHIGGVVGYASHLTITNCYNTGSVSGSINVGGVVGYTPFSTVTTCYNTGSVSGSGSGNSVGGVAGNIQDTSIANCYNTGSVSGGYYVGGVVGNVNYLGHNSTIISTYYGGDCTLNKGVGSGEGSATKIDSPVEEWAKDEEWYLDSSNWYSSYPWNFETVWTFGSGAPNYVVNNGYPVLQSFGTEIPEHEIIYWTDESVWSAAGKNFNNYSLAGSGTEEDPYLIQSETDLAFLSWTIYNDQVYGGEENKYTSGINNYFYLDVYFKQTKNLDLSAYYWQPIGIDYTREGTSASRYFSGNYDGGGYTVSGVFTPAGSGDAYSYQGLFGYIQGRSSTQRASIANVGVIDSFVQGYDYIGGVVGEAWFYVDITNIYNTGRVSGKENVAGIAGESSFSANIINAYNTGSVSGSSYVGGLVGMSTSNTTITNAYNTGLISGTGDYVGGVVGYVSYNSTITNAYNTGSVSGNTYVGGLVGYMLSDSRINIFDCGVECAVITGTSDVGIFVGQNASSSATIENCYAIVGGDLSPYGSNFGTVTNCLWIAGGVKYYLGTDFSGFAWLNTDSCPIPKGLSWMGQFWTEDITSQITSSSDWTEWVA